MDDMNPLTLDSSLLAKLDAVEPESRTFRWIPFKTDRLSTNIGDYLLQLEHASPFRLHTPAYQLHVWEGPTLLGSLVWKDIHALYGTVEAKVSTHYAHAQAEARAQQEKEQDERWDRFKEFLGTL